jgi:hypothetical protein
MHAREIIDKFGGQTALASLLGKGQSTIAYWARSGAIPAKWQTPLLHLAEARGIPLSAADFMLPIKLEVAGPKSFGNNDLVAVMPSKVAAPSPQGRLDLGIDRQIEIDGIGMGVLSDGTPFLTLRGLARLCGVNHSVIQGINDAWGAPIQASSSREVRLREILASHGETPTSPYIAIQQRSGTFYAYPDSVCLAVLEYYSFDAGANIRDEAKRNYRLLAGKALRDFIYTQVGYDPNNNLPDQWRHFHDRVSLTYNSVPKGYFGIFKEIADMIVTLGQAGLHIDAKFVPDISVGQHWANYWKSQGLEQKHGERIQYEHNYPSYFPQSTSNPQEPWCYPEQSLGDFRRWFREVYIKEGKFKAYIENKVKERALPISFAQLAIAAYVRD